MALKENNELHIVSYGGGVDSTAMLVGMVNRGFVPDMILFADTGGEKPWTYEYLKLFSDWLQSKGFPRIVTVKERLTLEQDVLNNKTLPSVAFGFKTCSQKFKTRPQHRFLRDYARKHGAIECVHFYVGFDASESRRVKPNPTEPTKLLKSFVNHYPLIEWGWTRKQCEAEILAVGLRLPKKSACFFCPNSKVNEILGLPDELKKRAIEMERNAEKAKRVDGLGRQFKWEDVIKGDAAQAKLYEDHAQKFKEKTGEDLEPIVCECIG